MDSGSSRALWNEAISVLMTEALLQELYTTDKRNMSLRMPFLGLRRRTPRGMSLIRVIRARYGDVQRPRLHGFMEFSREFQAGSRA
jgi:hypothetical protein